MIINYIVDFVQYLNENGFEITNDKISRFFYAMNDTEIDFTERDDVLSLMQTTFCTNKYQVDVLPEYFDNYINQKDKINKTNRLNEEVKKSKNHLDEFSTSIETEINKLLQEIEEIAKKIREQNLETQSLLTKSEKAFVDKNTDKIKELLKKVKNKIIKDLIKNCILKNDSEAFQNFSKPFNPSKSSKSSSKSVEELLLDECNAALNDGRLDDFKVLKKLFDIVCRLSKISDLQENTINEAIKKATTEQNKKINKLEKELKKEKKKHKEIQDKLNQLMNQQMETVVKEYPDEHRRFFIGKNAVQIIGSWLPKCMFTDFEILTKNDIDTIYYYIKKNVLKFKTKLTRSIQSQDAHKIDMKTTIQNACKTRGLPIKISYKKPKPNKTNLILVLDVSGSCKDASTMMLTFIHLLQSVFPRGCQAFAFVDSLYDISDIMKTDNIKVSVNNVLSQIPRGYSDYYSVLKSLWTEHKQEITSDSIVIFMGDARNNDNNSGIEYVKNITRKAKMSYWLNTEDYNKWGYADSIAFEYAKYFKMFEIRNSANLINFIQNIGGNK